MEKVPNNNEDRKGFALGARRALNSGLSAEELKELVDKEAKSLSVGEDIRAFLMEYISTNKEQISQPEDFDAVAEERLDKMREWHHKPDMTLEEARTHIFNPWEKSERGLAYLSSEDPFEMDMYFKGSDGQLYRVAFDLKLLKFNSEDGEKTIDRDTLHEHLSAHSPFKAFASTMNSFGPGGYDNTPNKGFRDCVNDLLNASRQRRDAELLQQKEVTRQSLLDQMGL